MLINFYLPKLNVDYSNDISSGDDPVYYIYPSL